MALYAFDKAGFPIHFEVFGGDFVVDDEKVSVATTLANISNRHNASYRHCKIGKVVKEFKGERKSSNKIG